MESLKVNLRFVDLKKFAHSLATHFQRIHCHTLEKMRQNNCHLFNALWFSRSILNTCIKWNTAKRYITASAQYSILSKPMKVHDSISSLSYRKKWMLGLRRSKTSETYKFYSHCKQAIYCSKFIQFFHKTIIWSDKMHFWIILLLQNTQHKYICLFNSLGESCSRQYCFTGSINLKLTSEAS